MGAIMTFAKLVAVSAFAVSAAALASCGNAVTSLKPLFSTQDARGQAQPRPGVWGYSNSTMLPTCKVDTSQPFATWDRCAGGFVVRPGEVLGLGVPGGPLVVDYRFVLARGAPAVFQVLVVGDQDLAGRYYYTGMRPVKFDSQGRVIELKAWQAMCGPSPPEDPTGQGAKLTDQMIRGLTADERHENCVTTSAAPVRVSVKASDAWATKSGGGVNEMYVQWVRDGEQ
jgi:hypothetical protein